MKRKVNKKYLEFVVSLPCCHCGAWETEAHHIKGVGLSGFGTRANDIHTMPLCRKCHTGVHKDVKAWPQARWMIETQLEAIYEGILVL